jgi:transglutaminase-like putative cysteine protease
MTATTTTVTPPPRVWAPATLRLGAEITRAALRARRLVRRNDLPTALARCRASAPPSRPAPAPDHVVRLGRAVRRTLAALPGDSRCLVTSLVLIAVLARRGIGASLVIGVRPGKSFGAHAWVEVHGMPALPAVKGKFAHLVTL